MATGFRRIQFYLLILVLSFAVIALLLYVLFMWGTIGPFSTILASIELGVLGTILLVVYANRKKLIISEKNEKKAISRISELNDSFKKLTLDMQNLNNEVEDEIEESKNKLTLLEQKITDFSDEETKLRNEIKLLQETKPEVAQFIINETRKDRTENLIRDLIFFCLGVIVPYIINFIFFS